MTFNICPSRKSMHSVMSNAGFGTLNINSNGYVVTLPNSAIKKANGDVKESFKKRINNLTIESALWLQARGASVVAA